MFFGFRFGFGNVTTNASCAEPSIIKLCWTTNNEQPGIEKIPPKRSGDVLGNADLLAKAEEEKVMVSNDARALMAVLKRKHGFVLGEEMIDAPEAVLREFSANWIARAMQSGGFSREILEKAIAGEGSTEALEFAAEWQMLLRQAAGTEYRVEMDSWSFVLCVEKAGRGFRMPYCSTAMSACNKIIQYYDRIDEVLGTSS